MEGQLASELRGIIPRSFDYIFSSIKESGEATYLVRASFLEIYNETIRDLLAPGADKHESGKGLDLRENKDRGVFVAGLRSEVVESVPAMLALLQVIRSAWNSCCVGQCMHHHGLQCAVERQCQSIDRRNSDEPRLVTLTLNFHHHSGMHRRETDT